MCLAERCCVSLSLQLAYLLDDAAVRFVVAEPLFAAPLTEALAAANALRVGGVLWIGDAPTMPLGGIKSVAYSTAIEAAARRVASYDGFPPVEVVEAPSVSELPCEMYYTSGTTGFPKGVMLSHANVAIHAIGCLEEHGIHVDDVWGHFAPIFHLVDAYSMFSITMAGGSHVFVSGAPAFSAAAVVAAIATHRVTVSNVAASMIPLLLNQSHGAGPTGDSRTSHDLTSLELLSCGGSPLSRELVCAALGAFGSPTAGCEFFLSYGMTECGGKISYSLLDRPGVRQLTPQQQIDIIASSGRPFGPIEVRLVNEGGPPITEPDVPGEVQIRGPTVFTGYHARPDASAEAFTADGWFRTGDVAKLDTYGYLTVCDRYTPSPKLSPSWTTLDPLNPQPSRPSCRPSTPAVALSGPISHPASAAPSRLISPHLAPPPPLPHLAPRPSRCRVKDMILMGGENVYSVEVERVLADHPAVLYCAVYGVPNDLLGELVKAVVVLQPGALSQPAASVTTSLRQHCAQSLADFKCPRLIQLMPLEQLPLTGSGKVAKAELRTKDASRATSVGAASAARVAPPPQQSPSPLLEVRWEREWLKTPAVGEPPVFTPRLLLCAPQSADGASLAAALRAAAGALCVELPDPLEGGGALGGRLGQDKVRPPATHATPPQDELTDAPRVTQRVFPTSFAFSLASPLPPNS